ncbi:MAG: metallophosphoesterase family protein [Eggerthellaceae bacterium]|nr:metallophosphoesterase family protein [Eggerthellaceae bacterium]
MTRVGVISDTHGRLADAAYAAMADSDYIIHAGDIGDPAILRELETLAPVYAVLGNNDFDEYGEDVGRIIRPTIEGVRFCVAHYPQDVRLGLGSRSALHAGMPIPHVRIHGHTHAPKLVTGVEARPSDLLLCPGSASRPRSGYQRSVAHLDIEDGVVSHVWVETLLGDIVMEWSR